MIARSRLWTILSPVVILILTTSLALATCTYATRVKVSNCHIPFCVCGDYSTSQACLNQSKGFARYVNDQDLFACDGLGNPQSSIYAPGITTCGDVEGAGPACVWLTSPNNRCVCDGQEPQGQWGSTSWYVGYTFTTCSGGCGDGGGGGSGFAH